MKKEEKYLLHLLFKDLCARLPYKPKALVNGHLATILGIDENVVIVCIDGNDYKDETIISADDNGDDVKPYLRPMSSMTEEEREIYYNLCYEEEREEFEFGEWSARIHYHDTIDSIDYLNSIHIDYRDLIPKNLAIEVTEENNPYEA